MRATEHTITNDAGRKFLVRIVRQGDRYGRNDVLVHTKAMPLIEFYDRTYPKFGPRGQFVSSYYAHTLFEMKDAARAGRGLALNAGVPEWTIDGRALLDALSWANGVLVLEEM